MSSDNNEGTNRQGDYEVGKNKPPKQHQFKKGKEWRGNRHGRPSDSLNHSTMVRKVFGRKTPLVDPETGEKLNGREAYYLSVRNDSLKGKPHAVRLVDVWFQGLASEEKNQVNEVPENHQKIIEKALERRAKKLEKRAGDV